MLANTVAEFVAAATTAPTETQFWGPLDATLTQASQHSAHSLGRDITCSELADLAADANRLALCAYLQGFYDLAWETTTREIRVLSETACPCARVYEVQPWVNLARLSRAKIQPRRLNEALAGLVAALDRAVAVDPRSLPVDASVGLSDGSIARAAQHVGTLETAKLKWLLGDFGACEELARTAAPASGVAMELTVRSRIELRRLDEAISLAAAFVSRFGWLSAYAIIALLRGGAREEAAGILASVRGDYALPLLRVAIELARVGLPADAAALGVRIVEASVSSQQEVPALLAGAFLIANGYIVEGRVRDIAMRIASTSQHYPSVVLLELVVASQERDPLAVETVAEGLRFLHHKSLPRSTRRLLRTESTDLPTLEVRNHRQSRMGESLCITAAAASGVLTAMSAHR
jgi:hypothetical protein